MATFEEEQQRRDTLHKGLQELSNINAQDLIRADVLGKELSFESGRQVFERVLSLFHDLQECNLDDLPYNILNSLSQSAQNALSTFRQIRGFTIQGQPDPVSARDNLIRGLQNSYDSYFAAISPIISYSIRKSTDFETLEKKAHNIVASIDAKEKELTEKTTNIISQAESTLQKIRQAAAEVGVAQHATHFKEEAEYHKKQSSKWLKATLAATVLTGIWGGLSFWIHPETYETAMVIQYTVAKLIILSALYYALVWCARNYNAHRHNFVVNKHRQNSLSTFETFVKAAGEDTDTKHAVLLQATQSIFSGQSSGYIHKDSDSESPNKIIEIMRSVGSSGTKS